MSTNYLRPARIEIKRYPRHVEPDAKVGAFRCYKSSPEHGTIQLRGETSFATWSYVSRDELNEIIKALADVRDAIHEAKH